MLGCILVASSLAGSKIIETNYTKVVALNAPPVYVYRCPKAIDFTKFTINTSRPLRELNKIEGIDNAVIFSQGDNRASRVDGHNANNGKDVGEIIVKDVYSRAW